MPPADPQHYAHGQYQGYTDTPGVAPGSTTETYGALRLEIDNWRWADVPIFIQAGKAPPVNVTEVRLLLHRTSRLSSLPGLPGPTPNQIVLRIDPDPGMRLQLSALASQPWRTVSSMTFRPSASSRRSANSGFSRPANGGCRLRVGTWSCLADPDAGQDRCDDVVAEGEERADGAGRVGGNMPAGGVSLLPVGPARTMDYTVW